MTRKVWRSSDTEGFREVYAAVRAYIDGFYASDADLLAKVFHSVSHLYSVDREGGRCVPVAAWLDVVRSREPIAVVDRMEEIRSIAFLDANTAIVRVALENAASYFEDCLILVCEGANWKVISKAFAVRSKASGE